MQDLRRPTATASVGESLITGIAGINPIVDCLGAFRVVFFRHCLSGCVNFDVFQEHFPRN
jgi:hypothetical protein